MSKNVWESGKNVKEERHEQTNWKSKQADYGICIVISHDHAKYDSVCW